MNEVTLEAVCSIADLCRANGGSVSPEVYERIKRIVQTAIDAESERLRDLVRKYPEWEPSLDETAFPTGFVDCIVCDGGGWTGDKRKKYPPPRHKEDCERARLEREYPDR